MCVYALLSLQVMIVCMFVDLEECVEGQHQCQQRCINTFGSFKCSCDDGYQAAHDQTSCTGVCVAVYLCLFMSFMSLNKWSVFLAAKEPNFSSRNKNVSSTK